MILEVHLMTDQKPRPHGNVVRSFLSFYVPSALSSIVGATYESFKGASLLLTSCVFSFPPSPFLLSSPFFHPPLGTT